MLKHYLQITVRSLARQKAFAAINVFGLAVGMAACLLIGLFVRLEWSYDRFHEHSDRLYRAWTREDMGYREAFANTVTHVSLGPVLEEAYPEVEAAVRVRTRSDVVGEEGRAFTEVMHLVDPNFFEVFSFPLLHGDPSSALSGREQVVLTPELADRYFPGIDPIGRMLPVRFGDEVVGFTVSGIADAPPVASSIRFEMLLPYENIDRYTSEAARNQWFIVSTETYVLLAESADASALEAKFPSVVRQHLSEEDAAGFSIHLQSIGDIHLNTSLPAGIEPTSDPRYAYILTIIALLLLAVASINFVTLSIGQSSRRYKEVGLRQCLGAPRARLMRQFWGEAFLVTTVSLLLGLVFARAFLPLFSTLADREIPFQIDATFAAMFVALLIVVGLGAGSYPALVLSGLKPVEALRDRLRLAGDRSMLRRTLVVGQFAVSILMIISTMFIVQQLGYLQNKNLGFDKEHLVVVRTGVDYGRASQVIERFKHAAEGREGVLQVSSSGYALDEPWMQAGYQDLNETWRTFRLNWMDADFLSTTGIELIAGRSFLSEGASDSMRIIVNDALVRDYGWRSAAEALGRQLPGADFPPHEIVGVVPDFHYATLKSRVEPLVLVIDPRWVIQSVQDVNSSVSSRLKMSIRIRTQDLLATMAFIERTWTEVAADLPYDYYFLDDAIDARYRQEERLAAIASAAATFAVLIACLGLFGLALLTVTRRMKEIGVRKVLGASVASVVAMLSTDFVRLVLVAFVIAGPVAYWVMSRWLEDFPYRVSLSPVVFVLAGVVACGVALVTVSLHTLRAATSDPVRALRYE